ncbi:bis(5'-nucleosyl)-tetraphosphatase [soil metagenome]
MRLPSIHHFRRNLDLYRTGIDESFGIIVYKWRSKKPLFLAIRHQQGHWDFPKGHAEGNEKPIEAALRETQEEVGLTGLKVEKNKTFQEKYEFKVWGRRVSKVVTFWISESQHADVEIQQTEIAEFKWITLEEGHELITFEAGKILLTQVAEYLQTK